MIERTRWREDLKKRFSPPPVSPESEVRDGWRDLICDLVDLLDQTGIPYKIDQVQEKFGALRFYVDAPEDHRKSDDFFRLVEEAEAKSETICDRCAAPGTLRGTICMETLCDRCHDELRRSNWRFMERPHDLQGRSDNAKNAESP